MVIAPGAPPSVAAQIRASEAALWRAMQMGDVTQLDLLLHDDLLFNTPDGATATKAMDLANYAGGAVSWTTVEGRDLQVSAFGEVAVVAVTVRLVGDYAGMALDGDFRYLRAWLRVDGSWRVIGGSVTPMTPMS
ncbi:MAG: nuclear transport factor 2 family protein [Tetrasphaera sp.]